MDYSKLSLTQAKRLEMESQVKALELEKELQMERTRLAELRKVHYHLAGASEGWEVSRAGWVVHNHVRRLSAKLRGQGGGGGGGGGGCLQRGVSQPCSEGLVSPAARG